MNRRTAVQLTAVLLLIAAPGSPTFANGVVRDSVGGTSSGRGGTNIAHYDNGVVLLDNPAGIINFSGNGLFEFGADLLVTDLHYSDPQTSDDARFRPMGLPQVSYVRKSDDDRWAAGVGVFVPAGFGAQWDMNAPFPIPGNRGYKSIGGLVKVLPAAAYRVTDRLSVGATLGVGLSHAELEGPFFVQTGPLAGVPTLLDLQTTGAAPTWSLGAQYIVNDRTVIGLVYTSETRLKMDGSAEAHVFGLGPEPLRSDFDAELDLVWPRSAGIGITHLLGDRHRISADVVWYDWSHAFDRLDLRLSNPSNPAFAPLSPIKDRFPLKWRDSVSVRLGHEYFPTCCDVVRFGYIYNTDVIPDSTLTPYIPAAVEHAFSLGYGRRWKDCRIDLAYQYTFGEERHVSNSHLVGGDFSNSELKAQAHWFFLSFTREF